MGTIARASGAPPGEEANTAHRRQRPRNQPIFPLSLCLGEAHHPLPEGERLTRTTTGKLRILTPQPHPTRGGHATLPRRLHLHARYNLVPASGASEARRRGRKSYFPPPTGGAGNCPSSNIKKRPSPLCGVMPLQPKHRHAVTCGTGQPGLLPVYPRLSLTSFIRPSSSFAISRRGDDSSTDILAW